MTRKIVLLSHPERPDAIETARIVTEHLAELGIETVTSHAPEATAGAELILVIGGDGTILRAAEFGRPAGLPILGINYGHVGFLSEADPDEVPMVMKKIASGAWQIVPRMTIDIIVTRPDGTTDRSWALNEAAVEKDEHARMIEASIGVDNRELSSLRSTPCCSPRPLARPPTIFRRAAQLYGRTSNAWFSPPSPLMHFSPGHLWWVRIRLLNCMSSPTMPGCGVMAGVSSLRRRVRW